MNKIRIIIQLSCLCLSASLCKAEKVHMDMAMDGPAAIQPNGEYEVVPNGVIQFTVKQPKMPKRDEEIWIFQWRKLGWFLDGVPQPNFENSLSIQVAVDPKRAPRQVNCQSLLTYDYLQKGTKIHVKDYGESDLFILNFTK